MLWLHCCCFFCYFLWYCKAIFKLIGIVSSSIRKASVLYIQIEETLEQTINTIQYIKHTIELTWQCIIIIIIIFCIAFINNIQQYSVIECLALSRQLNTFLLAVLCTIQAIHIFCILLHIRYPKWFSPKIAKNRFIAFFPFIWTAFKVCISCRAWV